MKRQTTPKTPAPLALTRLLLAALLAVACSGILVAQEGVEVEPDEPVSVNSQVVRIGIAVPPSVAPAKLVVRRGTDVKQQVSVDRPGPSSPLSLVILLDLSSPSGKGWQAAREHLLKLPEQVGLVAPPHVVVADPTLQSLPDGTLPRDTAKLPDGWQITFARDVRTAFDQAIAEIERAKTPRRALLILTDRFADLPVGIFEQTDERLTYSPALVFLATVRSQKPIQYGSPDRTISRMNLVGWERVAVRVSGDYIGAQFDYFARAANSLHVVSFPVPDGELSESPTYIVEARSEKDGRVLNRQPRRINFSPEGQTFLTHARAFPFDATPPKDEEDAPPATPAPAAPPMVVATSVTRKEALPQTPASTAADWLDSAEFSALVSDPTPIFDRIEAGEQARAKAIDGLPQWVRDGRVQEGTEVERVRTALRPLLEAFPAASKLEVFVYKSDAVFVALAERSLLVVSTGAANFFSASELMSGSSHEMAHLYFFEAYLDAFERRDYAQLQLIELKCDALGTALSVRAGEQSDMLARAIRRHALLLQQLSQYDPVLVPMHPVLADRLMFLGRVREYLDQPPRAHARK